MFERNRIAETLRSAREKQGMSLEQAAAAAGVPLQYVRLLEGESNVRVGVSDELYLIPFFRKYARFVGIDAEEMLPEFLGVVQQIPGEGSPPVRLAYRPRLGFLWRPLAVVVTIAIAVALMLRQSPERPTFDDASPRGSEEQAPQQIASGATPVPVEPSTAATVTTTEIASTPVAAGAVGPSPNAASATPQPSISSSAVAAVTGAHELKIDAIEEAWLALGLNDQPAKQYLLRAGESRSWNADQFSLTVGNAGGVAVALDGRTLGPIGKPGKVVRNLRLPGPVGSPSPASTPITAQ